jgi:ABC-type transport system involved in multi-copper enzyme maturation permease subunit
MTWVVWRQHSNQLLFGVVALAVLGAFFLLTGLPIHDQYETSGVADCLPQAMEHELVPDLVAASIIGNTDTLDPDAVAANLCAQRANEFYNPYQWVIFTGLLLLVLPMLVGMFWGAPLVARELEHGTHLLVWTQGVTRRRWAVSKIALVTLGVLALTAIFTAMLAWWITPVVLASGQRFAYVFFDVQGYLVIGYTLFALALGVYAGTVTRRTPSAMAATLVGFLGLRLIMMIGVRPRMLPTQERLLQSVSQSEAASGVVPMSPNLLHGDWVLDRVEQIPGVRTTETFHPASQFWTMQGIETIVFLIAGAILIWLAFRRITTRGRLTV